jgi:hypothetical protein
MGSGKYHIVCVHNFAQHDNKIWALFKLRALFWLTNHSHEVQLIVEQHVKGTN